MAEAMKITDPAFWQLPLEDRMRRFGDIREADPFTFALSPNPLTAAPAESGRTSPPNAAIAAAPPTAFNMLRRLMRWSDTSIPLDRQ